MYKEKSQEDSSVLDMHTKAYKNSIPTINNSIRNITEFANVFAALSQCSLNYRANVSTTFKDLIQRYQNVNQFQDISSIPDAVKTVDEVLSALIQEFEVKFTFSSIFLEYDSNYYRTEKRWTS
jgi:hypothetical protein